MRAYLLDSRNTGFIGTWMSHHCWQPGSRLMHSYVIREFRLTGKSVNLQSIQSGQNIYRGGNKLNAVKKTIFNLSLWISILLVFSVLIFSIFVCAEYDYDDYPYFTRKSILEHFLYLGIAGLIGFSILALGRMCKWNTLVAMIVFFAVSIVYLILIPLKPFSDMGIVWEIATNGLKDESGYLSYYNNQIPLVIYLWVISNLFGNSILVPKIMNIVLCSITLIYTKKIWELYSKEKIDKKIIWFAMPFIPIIIYMNHIYNDILFTTLTIVLLYYVLLYKETIGKQTSLLASIILLSAFQYVIRPVGIIYIVAIAIYMLFFRRELKKTLIYCLLSVLFIVGITTVNKTIFKIEDGKSFPVWSYIQMGINEKEFGFQDGTHSSDWTFDDCIQKYKTLGLKKVFKIFAKKIIWVWSEGTYQAERYGFGSFESEYTSDNSIVKEIRDIRGSTIRNVINKIMKGQYYIYLCLALFGIILMRNKESIGILYIIICGFLIFYTIWEIKSRYIFSLYPILMVFAYAGYNKIVE